MKIDVSKYLQALYGAKSPAPVVTIQRGEETGSYDKYQLKIRLNEDVPVKALGHELAHAALGDHKTFQAKQPRFHIYIKDSGDKTSKNFGKKLEAPDERAAETVEYLNLFNMSDSFHPRTFANLDEGVAKFKEMVLRNPYPYPEGYELAAGEAYLQGKNREYKAYSDWISDVKPGSAEWNWLKKLFLFYPKNLGKNLFEYDRANNKIRRKS